MSAREFLMSTAQRSLTHTRRIGALILIVATGVLPAGQVSETEQPNVSITPRALVSRTAPGRSNLRFDVTQVLVPVTVMDATDHPVANLPLEKWRSFRQG